MTAPTISDSVFDAALNLIKNNTENLYICSAQPLTCAEANTTYALGVKATPAFTGPADGVTGRKLTLDAITDGTVTGSDTATWFALTDDSSSDLLTAQELAASQVVTSGNVFTLTACIINFPDPTS